MLVDCDHGTSLEDAQALLDAITERQLPEVWSVIGKKRVLDAKLDYASQTLVLLYSDPEAAVPAEDHFAWTEYSSLSGYRRNVLSTLHSLRYIEYDRETEMVVISPSGISRVEQVILKAEIDQNQEPSPDRRQMLEVSRANGKPTNALWRLGIERRRLHR